MFPLSPFRGAGPPIPRPPDRELDAYEASLHRRRRRIIAIYVLVAALPVLVCFGGIGVHVVPDYWYRYVDRGTELTPAEQAGIDKELAVARERSRAAQATYGSVLASAQKDGIGPRPDLGACPYRLAMPETGSGSWYPSPFPLVRVKAGDAVVPAARISSYDADIASLASSAKERYREKATPGRLLRRAQDLATRSLSWDVTFVTEHASEPKAIGRVFASGEVQGMAYLYDHRSGRIACAARIFATNSESVEFTTYTRNGLYSGDSAALERAAAVDLDDQVLRRIALDMRFKAGPLAAAPPEPDPATALPDDQEEAD
jgi:hypothetical protein